MWYAISMKKLLIILAAFTLLTFAPVSAQNADSNETRSVDSSVIEDSLREKGLDEAPGVVEVEESEMLGQEPYSGFVDEDGNPISDEDYEKMRKESSGVQWKNIAILAGGLVLVGGAVAGVIVAKKRK